MHVPATQVWPTAHTGTHSTFVCARTSPVAVHTATNASNALV
ncbi:MAG TPA: hypothetical protein VK989_08680 [Polyangia bacterium]|nr:hypothetical protein [Polyangia bacterium]